jgi:hypothetical protein
MSQNLSWKSANLIDSVSRVGLESMSRVIEISPQFLGNQPFKHKPYCIPAVPESSGLFTEMRVKAKELLVDGSKIPDDSLVEILAFLERGDLTGVRRSIHSKLQSDMSFFEDGDSRFGVLEIVEMLEKHASSPQHQVWTDDNTEYVALVQDDSTFVKTLCSGILEAYRKEEVNVFLVVTGYVETDSGTSLLESFCQDFGGKIETLVGYLRRLPTIGRRVPVFEMPFHQKACSIRVSFRDRPARYYTLLSSVESSTRKGTIMNTFVPIFLFL